MPLPDRDIEALADRILRAAASVSSIPPITDGLPDFDLHNAYRVADTVMRRRIARGERPTGWKIGFTNETIWEEYGVHAPIWGAMYDSTAAEADVSLGSQAWPIGALFEPRIEPEIAFRLSATPRPGMSEAELLACIDAVTHGFEIVQSVFPNWRFKAADTVAAFALHGAYRHGPFVNIRSDERATWAGILRSFEIRLSCDGVLMDTGAARNVLGGGPLVALKHFVDSIPEFSPRWVVRPGDIVTTGTVTRAFPVRPGERWSTEVVSAPLAGMNVILIE